MSKERPPRRYPLRGLAAALGTAVLGPPLGGLVIALPIVLGIVFHDRAGDRDAWGLILQFTALSMLYGYVLGGLPALIAGLWQGFMVWRHGHVSYRAAALVGALAGLALTVPFTVARGDGPSGLIGLLSLVGAVVAVILVAVFAGTGIIVRPTHADRPPSA